MKFVIIPNHVFRSEKESGRVHIYDGRGDSAALKTIDKLHYKPLTAIKVRPHTPNTSLSCICIIKRSGKKLY